MNYAKNKTSKALQVCSIETCQSKQAKDTYLWYHPHKGWFRLCSPHWEKLWTPYLEAIDKLEKSARLESVKHFTNYAEAEDDKVEDTF